MSDEYIAPNPLFVAHKHAFLAAGRDAADAVLVKFGGKVRTGRLSTRFPESKVKAAILALESLAASTPPTARTAAGFEQIRRTAMGSGERWDNVRRDAFDNAGTRNRKSPLCRSLSPS